MQAQKYPDFDSFMEDLAPIIAGAPEEDEFSMDFRIIEDSETVVLVILNPVDSMLELFAVRSDGLKADLPFSFADRAADDNGWDMYVDIGNNLFCFLQDEDAASHGAEKLEKESRLQVVADINDLCEKIDEVDRGARSFSFIKELDAYVFLEYIPEGTTMLAIAMNKTGEVATLGVRLKEQLRHTTPTILGLKIIEQLEKGLLSK